MRTDLQEVSDPFGLN